jgi:hypothetical protein
MGLVLRRSIRIVRNRAALWTAPLYAVQIRLRATLCGHRDAEPLGSQSRAFHARSDFLEGYVARDIWRTVLRLNVDAEGRETTVVRRAEPILWNIF